MRARRLACFVLGGSVALSGVAQSPAPDLPGNYQVVLNTPEARVLRAHYAPHERVPVHDHPAYPTIFVYLNDSGVVRISHTDGGASSIVNRPPTHTGAFRVAPGKSERHSIENVADVPADSVLVELKSLPAQAITEEFRGPAPTQPLLTSTKVVYENPALRIERILCDPGATCTLEAETAPSVLIAVTKAGLFGPNTQSQMLTMEQPTSQLGAGERAGVRALGPVPAQLLRVVLLKH